MGLRDLIERKAQEQRDAAARLIVQHQVQRGAPEKAPSITDPKIQIQAKMMILVDKLTRAEGPLREQAKACEVASDELLDIPDALREARRREVTLSPQDIKKELGKTWNEQDKQTSRLDAIVEHATSLALEIKKLQSDWEKISSEAPPPAWAERKESFLAAYSAAKEALTSAQHARVAAEEQKKAYEERKERRIRSSSPTSSAGPVVAQAPATSGDLAAYQGHKPQNSLMALTGLKDTLPQ